MGDYHPTQMTVSSNAIVKGFDVIEHIGPGEISRFVDAFADTLFLQAA